MSVYLGELVVRAGRTPVSLLASYRSFALASFTAGLARQCNQGVAGDPLPTEPAHGLVFGDKPHSVRKRLARESRWVVPPAWSDLR
jgi:hypothetical protein